MASEHFSPSSRRPGFGLALGGGAVRGAAHLGVLSVLEEEGLEPSCVAGTSVGAILGAGFASGISVAELMDGFRRIRWFRLVSLSLHPATSLSLLDSSGLETLLRNDFGLSNFSELRLPFAAVACDLGTGEAVVIREGDLVEAVLASSALPGLFPPVRRDGRLLVDGGIASNLPIRATRELGADRILAVDLLADTLEDDPDNFLEVWQHSLYQMIRGQNPRPGPGDVILVPRVAPYSFTDFGEVDDLYEAGRDAALDALPRLKSLVPDAGGDR